MGSIAVLCSPSATNTPLLTQRVRGRHVRVDSPGTRKFSQDVHCTRHARNLKNGYSPIPAVEEGEVRVREVVPGAEGGVPEGDGRGEGSLRNTGSGEWDWLSGFGVKSRTGDELEKVARIVAYEDWIRDAAGAVRDRRRRRGGWRKVEGGGRCGGEWGGGPSG